MEEINYRIKNRNPRKLRPNRGTKSDQIVSMLTMTDARPSEIAKTLQCQPSHVTSVMQTYGLNIKRLDAFKKHRADLLAHMQDKLLNSIEDAEIKRTPVGSRILGACQLFDKERLERNLSTSNTASIHADIEELREMKAKQIKDNDEDL